MKISDLQLNCKNAVKYISAVINFNRLKSVRMSTYNNINAVIDKSAANIYLIICGFVISLNSPMT